MALPVAPPPPSEDIARREYAALTVRVAWVLLSHGYKVRPAVLNAARTHALAHLEPTTDLPQAEDHVEQATEDFLARARGRRPEDPFPMDWAMPVSARWRRAVEVAASPLARVVLTQHYDRRRPLEVLAENLGEDRIQLEEARGGLREVIRNAAAADRVPLDSWSADRLDRLLRRLVAWAPAGCPPVMEVLDNRHPQHAATCRRCHRLRKLSHQKILELDDLFPPLFGGRPTRPLKLAALQLHPRAGAARRRLLEFLRPLPTWPVGEDILLVHLEDPERWRQALARAAAAGAPHRDLLRGAVVDLPGEWTTWGPVGLGPDRAEREARSRPWGVVEEAGELPLPRPKPTSAAPAWILAGAFSVAAAALLLVGPRSPAPAALLQQAELIASTDGAWLVFDAAEPAIVAAVGAGSEGLVTVLSGESPAEKADHALGDGSYRAEVPVREVLVLASLEPVPLDSWLAEHPNLDALADYLAAAHPEVEVARRATGR